MIMHPVKEGTWLYEGIAPVRLIIEEVDRIPGSGDHEDAEKYREDKIGRFFHIAYSAAGDSRVCNGGDYFSSLEDAIHEAEKVFKEIQWK